MLAVPAWAASVWTVNNNGDPATGNAANCAANNANTCTLRDAIATALGGDTIAFSGDMTIVLASNTTLTLSRNITIDATGHTVAVDGNGKTTVFLVNLSVAAQLTGLTVQHGLGDTGGIASEGMLTLRNSTISGNSALGGGGIRAVSGTLTLLNSTVSGNYAHSYGGGISLEGVNDVQIINSTISSNTTYGGKVPYGEASAFGGGIALSHAGATLINSTLSFNFSLTAGGGIDVPIGSALTLTNSTLNGNSSGLGGGIENDGTLTLTNSTLSGNSSRLGGGIYDSGTLTLTNSTLSGNVASFGGGIWNRGTLTLINGTLSGNRSVGKPTVNANFSQSGDIYNATYGKAALTNTILADSCADEFTPNSSGEIYDNGGNLGANATCVSNAGTSRYNVSNLDLGPLQNNGGPTQTLLPGVGSAAINAIACTNAPPTDQRGMIRPDPASRELATPCDVGAVEANSISDEIFKNGFDP